MLTSKKILYYSYTTRVCKLQPAVIIGMHPVKSKTEVKSFLNKTVKLRKLTKIDKKYIKLRTASIKLSLNRLKLCNVFF